MSHKCISTLSSEVVLVTGGSGFLGQHIVKLLHERAPSVKEIRILDCVSYTKKLDFEEQKAVCCFLGDVRVFTDIDSAISGVDTVIHAAGLVSFGTKPDTEGMEECNVNGTKHVIEACIKHSVPRLVFTSTVDAAIGREPIVGGTEVNTRDRPSKFLFPGYPETKYEAEQMVLQANGADLPSGAKLHTLSLRSCVMFGELDPFYVVNGLKSAAERGGVLYRVGDCKAKMNQAYVGNVAWAHVCAMNKLVECGEHVGGRFYYITDDHPPMNSFHFMETFLQPHNYRLSRLSIPYWLIYLLLISRDIILYLISPCYSKNHQPALCSVAYVCTDYCFLSSRARISLDYRPLYTPEDARHRALAYYSKQKLD